MAWDTAFIPDPPDPNRGGGNGGGGGGGGKPTNPQKQMFDRFLRDLSDCISSLYGITLTTFQESHEGQNGLFEGKDSKGTISVVNDVGSYSKLSIRIITRSFTAVGWTPPNISRNQTNYTANNLNPELYKGIQIHELAHSLDQISSGSIFGSSEESADRLDDCIIAKQTERRKKK